MKMSINEDKIYTVKETAEILSVSKHYIRAKCECWELVCGNIWTPTRKIFRIKGSEINNFLNK